ncbi:MAG: hypothetical protein LBQ50_01815 [Planctomycetaceae bacterium]|jgi:hypothetical protein|nr:hypothetical protein [Planctomycetaceae bacterium]
MIQELINTSSQKCLDGNSGFGVVAQTIGMAPNLAADVSNLSGYKHLFKAGDLQNPVAYLHVIRRTSEVDRHIVSRVADCGNDYSGRSNRIAHHLIFENTDLDSFSCGPAAILLQPEIFRTQWDKPSQELPQDPPLPKIEFPVRKCALWEQLLGDAGWGGVVAERAEKGDPISLIFKPGMNLLPLLAEALALLPPEVRWKTTFSTYFMKSQELTGQGTNKIQIKCFLDGSDVMEFVRLAQKTLVIDFRTPPTEEPSGKYVEDARNATEPQRDTPPDVTEKSRKQKATPIAVPARVSVPVPSPFEQDILSRFALLEESDLDRFRQNRFHWIAVLVIACLVVLGLAGVTALHYKDTQYLRNELQNIVKDTQSLRNELQNAVKGAQSQHKSELQNAVKKAQSQLETELQTAINKTQSQLLELQSDVQETQSQLAQLQTAANKIEQKEKAKEKKEQLLQKFQKLQELPNVWENCGLSGSSHDLAFSPLKGSAFLWEIKEHVTINYTPFIKTAQTIQNQIIQRSYKQYRIEFYLEELGSNGNPRPKTILTIELKENGLNFDWDQSYLVGTNTDINIRRKLNRLLLAKLNVNVEIEGIETTKEINLLSPTKYNQGKFENLLKDSDQYFTLWKREEEGGREFIVDDTDIAEMLLDFDEWFNGNEANFVSKSKNFRKPSSTFCYAPHVNEEYNMVLQHNANWKIKYDVVPKKSENDLEQKRELEQEIETKENEIKNLQEQINNEPNQIKKTELETKITDNKFDIKIRRNELEKNEKKREQALNTCKNIRLETFSIYLLKHDTKPKDVDKPENRLLLFEVNQ